MSPIMIRSNENNNITLPAVAVLAGLPEQLQSQHRKLGLRHPLGIYNTSIALVARRVSRVVDLLPAAVAEAGSDRTAPRGKVEALLECQEALLQGLLQHMDDCINILRGFTGGGRDFNRNPHVRAYRRAVGQYRSRIGNITGRVRHGQGRLTLLVNRGTRPFAGYFVSVGLADGGVGPDPDIHKHGWTAFSFNRDLRFHLCHVLIASEHLARAIEGLTGTGASDIAPTHDALVDSISDVIDLPETYFPDEYQEPGPALRFEVGHDYTHQLFVDFIPFTDPLAVGYSLELQFISHGDGSTRQWKLPYFGVPPAEATWAYRIVPASVAGR